VKIGSAKFYLILAAILVVFIPPFAKYQELRYKNQKMAERIETLMSENKKLEGDKKRLETDIVYVERRAREKMGLVRKGEIVMKGPSDRSGSASRAGAPAPAKNIYRQ
jgi:cell division protein FtsB